MCEASVQYAPENPYPFFSWPGYSRSYPLAPEPFVWGDCMVVGEVGGVWLADIYALG